MLRFSGRCNRASPRGVKLLTSRMTLGRAALLPLTFLVFAAIAAAQDDPIRINTSIVRLNVGVVDPHGRPVTDLGEGSFDVFEDGVKQHISRFEPSDAPFSVVLMLDMSGSTLPFRTVLKQSAMRFLDALSPNDRVAVVEFYDKVNLRNDFTTNRGTIYNSIEVANGRGKTQLYKALDFALDKLSRENSRRKAIIVLTDGVDTTVRDRDHEVLDKLKDDQVPTGLDPSKSEILNGVLNRADAQGVTLYPLALPTGDPAKLADPTPRQVALFKAARQRLQTLADRSGGTLNAVNRLEEMGRIYAVVAAELRTLYTVEYTSSNEKHDGAWRAVRIEVRDPQLIARTRQGYFAK
jgi:VWFA-related protein